MTATLKSPASEKYKFKSDPVRAYLHEIGTVPRLTRDEEIIFGKRVQRMMALLSTKSDLEERHQFSQAAWAKAAGLTESELEQALQIGHQAREKMVKANLRLVVSIAKKYLKRNMELLDMIQEGNVGLHRGVEKFDPTQGYRFSTYAYWWIKQAITRAIAEKTRNIRLPIHIVEKLNKLKKTQRQLSQQLGRTPTSQELAAELDLSQAEVRRFKRLARQTLSLDSRVGYDDSDSNLIDLLEDDGQSPEDYLKQTHLQTDLQAALGTLEPKEEEVIRLRFGLDGQKPMTLAAVGDRLNISRERVRQVQRRALDRLRKTHRPQLQAYLAS